jgi:hypothetical protein
MSKEKLEKILERFEEEDFLKADGLDDAIIGVDGLEYRLVYGIEKCIDILAKDMKVTKKDLSKGEIEEGLTIKEKKYELASEYFYYNTLNAYVGEKTPIFIYENFED